MRKLAILAMISITMFSGCDDSSGPNPASGLHGWAVGGNDGNTPTILRTTDGLEWTAQGTDLILPGVALSSVCAIDSLTAWAAGGENDGFGVVLKTLDGGETWLRMGSEIGLPNAAATVYALSVDVAWVSGDLHSVYHTTDGGITWIDMSDPGMPDMFWQGIHGTSDSNIWVSGGLNQEGAIYHSADGGALWTSHADSLVADWPVLCIKALDVNNIWAVGHGFRVYRSTNGGIDWAMVVPDSLAGSPNDANEIVVLSPTEAWVALDYGNIWKTTDGGATWDLQTVPSGAQGCFMLGIHALDSNRAWAVGGLGYGATDGVMIETSDGGATWNSVAIGNLPELWDIDFTEGYN